MLQIGVFYKIVAIAVGCFVKHFFRSHYTGTMIRYIQGTVPADVAVPAKPPKMET